MNIDQIQIDLDKDGYLKSLNDWNSDVAHMLARNENIDLTNGHWELIECVRDFYREYDLSPAMRPLVKFVKQRLGPSKGTSIYLMQHFPNSPALTLAKVSGLPRPENCL